MSSDTWREREAAAMRGEGMPVRAIAAALGVSHPTVLRDLRAVRNAEAEAVLVALGGQAPAKPEEKTVNWSAWTTGGGKYARRANAIELRKAGLSLREIAATVGTSPATVLRDLRRDASWAVDQRRRDQNRRDREMLADFRASVLEQIRQREVTATGPG